MFDPHLATSSYYDRRFNTQAIKVLPGEYYATQDDTMIVTVLGSCVSVCLRDRYSGIGGLNHFMLPHDSSHDENSPIAAAHCFMDAFHRGFFYQSTQAIECRHVHLLV